MCVVFFSQLRLLVSERFYVTLFVCFKSTDVIISLYLGRIPYTAEEDDAILTYVSKHKADIGGNRLWQEMEKQRVTSHSWQSMKYRYRVRLAKKQSADAEEETAEEDSTATEGETKVIYLLPAILSCISVYHTSFSKFRGTGSKYDT